MDPFGRPQAVLVLGGTSQIAQAALRRWLAGGSLRRVVLAGRPGERLSAAAAGLARPGTEVSTVDFDATDTDAHAAVLAAVFATGDVDVVLLAFGVLGSQVEFERDPGLAVRAAQTNYVGGVSAGLVCADLLRRQGHGTLVVISSVAGERARRANFVYGSTKAGLDTFAQGLGDALVGSGVRVCVVRPGFVRTRMTAGLPEAPMTVAADTVGAAIVDAVARGRELVWVPGALRYVMSGLRHVPRAVFRRLPV